jgi:hypothetical protein
MGAWLAMSLAVGLMRGSQAALAVTAATCLVTLLWGGVSTVNEGLRTRDVTDVRLGITLLGGAFVAALILAADAALKALGT